jgi:hypothetical protein
MVFVDQEIIGHEEIRKRLYVELSRTKLHHAQLFTGQESIGKKLIALELARDILGRRSIKSLNNCPDFHFFDPIAGDTQKGESKEIRSLLSKLSLRAFEGGARVTVIDNAHELGRASANALLKTLEEPGSNSYFILISHNKELILPTVRSRCRVWSFAPLRPEEIRRILDVMGRTDELSENVLRAGSLAELDVLAEFATEAETLSLVFQELGKGSMGPWFRFLRAHKNLKDKNIARFCFRFLRIQARDQLRTQFRSEDALLIENLSLLEHYVLDRNLSAQLCLTIALKAYAEKVSLTAIHLEEQLAV